jgi:isopropylmalate/homocitrate/citramalate synthase
VGKCLEEAEADQVSFVISNSLLMVRIADKNRKLRESLEKAQESLKKAQEQILRLKAQAEGSS